MKASADERFRALMARLNEISDPSGLPLPGQEEEWQLAKKQIRDLVEASKTPRHRQLEAELKRLCEPDRGRPQPGNELRYWQLRGSIQAELEEDSFAIRMINPFPSEGDQTWLLWCLHESLGYAEELINRYPGDPYFQAIHGNATNAMKALERGRWSEAREWLVQVQVFRTKEKEERYKAFHEKDTEDRSAAGSKNKRPKAILHAAEEKLRNNEELSTRELVMSFPEELEQLDVVVDSKRYFVYRDGEKLVQVEDRTGRERDLTVRSLEPYVAEIREKLRRRST